ncbi:MAG: quinone oxidoreductase [Planctomycetota bacterium]|nr:MAG: quinone oxidoreductase [Planctomycetota bacterium]
MRAAYINETGPVENIVVGELADPRPTGSQVLVEVRAASVNPIDTYIRSGVAASPDMPRPYVLGSDLAGVVRAVGPDASRFHVGDRVWGANQGVLGRQGTFSQLAAVEERWLYPTPERVSDEQAAAMALVGITAHLGLVDEAELDAGETVIVNGGSGAVGSTVIQMARALGAHVIATTSGADKVEYCRSLGADHVLDHEVDDVPQRVAQIAPEGAHIWWETSRKPHLDTAVACLGRRGRIVLMAGRNARAELPVGPFYSKCLRMLGFVMFHSAPESQRRAAERINRWMASGALAAKIDRVATLEETAELHRLQEANTIDVANVIRGKLVVKL